MKPILLLALAFLQTLAFGQVKMSIEVGGKSVGTASLTQKVNADGSKLVELKTEFHKQLTIRSQNSYDKKGNPIRKFMEFTSAAGKLQKQIVATFDARGANVVILEGGNRKTRQIVLIDTAPRANAAEFWFIRDTPKPGDQAKNYVFNLDSQTWDLQTTVYRGRKSISVAGRQVNAHVVEILGEKPSVSYMDDQGLPLVIEAGSATVRRQ